MPVRFLLFSNDSALCAGAVRSYTKNRLVRTLSPSINLFRAAAFSRQMSLFFKYHINGLLQGLWVSIVYAGGDDVFLVGAWNHTLQAALRIQKHLRSYTCRALTISAGIAMFNEHYSIRAAAKQTAALEELLISADADALRISDAMPWRGDSFYLPKPIAASTSPAELSTVERKAVKKLAWIPASKFDRYTASLHSGTYPLDELDQSFGQAYEQTKASVTDGADAKPYFVGLYRLHAGCGLYVLCACEGNDQLKMLKELFTLLGLSGIGGRTSAGYGRFHLDGEPICLNTAEDASLRWMLQALERGTAPYLLLTSSLPTGEEMDAALEGAAFQLARRGGFASTEWVETPVKKQTQYFLTAGSVLQHTYQGELCDVGIGVPHPVYRYSKPLFMGVTL